VGGGSWSGRDMRGRRAQESAAALTGAVVDAGDSCTSCTPVVEGYVLSSALRSLPLAGRDVTRYVQKLLRCDTPCKCRSCCGANYHLSELAGGPSTRGARVAQACMPSTPAVHSSSTCKHCWGARRAEPRFAQAPLIRALIDAGAVRSCKRSEVRLFGMVVGRHAARLTAPGARRERRAPVPPDQWLDVARRIKEAHCYVCSDVAKANTRPLMRLRHLLLPCGYPECVLCVSVAGTAALSSAGCGRVWTLAEPPQRPTNADDTPCLPCLLPLTC